MKTTTMTFMIDADGITHEVKADGFFVKLWKEVIFTPGVAIAFAFSCIVLPSLIDWIMGW